MLKAKTNKKSSASPCAPPFVSHTFLCRSVILEWLDPFRCLNGFERLRFPFWGSWLETREVFFRPLSLFFFVRAQYVWGQAHHASSNVFWMILRMFLMFLMISMPKHCKYIVFLGSAHKVLEFPGCAARENAWITIGFGWFHRFLWYMTLYW